MPTTPLEKLLASAVNAVFVILISLPIGVWSDFSVVWSITAVLMFFVMQIADTHRRIGFRCLGMRVTGSRWERTYRRGQKVLYSFLYTLSFATLFVHVYAPFDVFLANMLLLQLPTVLLTGTTFHGWVGEG